jgi:PIN domain nuclease of toxin-antitoxin system
LSPGAVAAMTDNGNAVFVSAATAWENPFNRLLIAQARLGNLVLVTADAKIARYDVARLALR